MSEFNEPWVAELGDCMSLNDLSTVCYFHPDHGFTPEKIARIVACVNACAGIPNELLKDIRFIYDICDTDTNTRSFELIRDELGKLAEKKAMP